jgi:acyl-CoA synthetase (AMP-forming)/AMP-acid ligase II
VGITVTPTNKMDVDNFARYILTNLLAEPDKTIMIVGDKAVTCREFHRQVTSVADALKGSSIRPGDTVLVTLTPSIELYSVIVAIFAIGNEGNDGRSYNDSVTTRCDNFIKLYHR